MTPDKYDQNYRKVEDGGWTLVRYRVGNNLPETFSKIDELLEQLVSES